MNMLRSLFRQKDDPLMERADTLVQVANVNAIGAFTPLLDSFPILREVDTRHWDFILTIAGVFMAATRLRNLRLGERREQTLMRKVAERLNQWDTANGIRSFEHCKSFFERTLDGVAQAAVNDQKHFAASDTIGAWIVWDVLDRPPESEEERGLVRAVGVLVTHAFFDWWDEKSERR
jgi:hypothetical protein